MYLIIFIAELILMEFWWLETEFSDWRSLIHEKFERISLSLGLYYSIWFFPSSIIAKIELSNSGINLLIEYSSTS